MRFDFPSALLARRLAGAGLFLAVAVAAGVAAKPDKPDHSPGKGKGKSGDFVPPGHNEKFVPPGHRRAPVEIVVRTPPPALRTEVVVVRPSPRHVWVPGYWVYQTNSYTWMPGEWLLPPEPAAVWVAPRLENRSGVSIFVSGYWKL